MSSQKSEPPLIKKVYSVAGKSLRSNPVLFTPFIIFTFFEFIALIIIYLAPRMPLIKIFGPPIRALWGERFLHYPINFFLLPKLVSFSRMGLSILFGSLLTGMAVAIFFDVYNKKHIKLSGSFKAALKRYFYLLTVVFIFTLLFYLLGKIINKALIRYFISGHTRLLFLGAAVWLGPLMVTINFVLALLIQSPFIYAIPLIIIERAKFIRAIFKSFLLFKKLLIPTLILVGLPMLVYIPIIILQYKSSFLINKLFPESILWVSSFGIILSSLVIDTIVTISTTALYLINREKGA